MKKTILFLLLISSLLSGCTYGLAFLTMAAPVKEQHSCSNLGLVRIDNGEKVPDDEACRIIYSNNQCDYWNTSHKGTFYPCLKEKGYTFKR